MTATEYCDERKQEEKKKKKKKRKCSPRFAAKVHNMNSMYYLLKRHVKASVFSL